MHTTIQILEDGKTLAISEDTGVSWTGCKFFRGHCQKPDMTNHFVQHLNKAKKNFMMIYK